MPFMYSKQHKELRGHVEGTPYRVLFDADGNSAEEVSDEVAQQLVKLKAASIVPDVASDAAVDLDKMNPAQLKSYAKKKEIDYGAATTKAELLSIIRGAETQTDETGALTTDPTGAAGGANA